MKPTFDLPDKEGCVFYRENVANSEWKLGYIRREKNGELRCVSLDDEGDEFSIEQDDPLEWLGPFTAESLMWDEIQG